MSGEGSPLLHGLAYCSLGNAPGLQCEPAFRQAYDCCCHREQSGWNQSHDHAFGLDDFGRQGRFIGILSVLLLPSQ